MHFGGRENLDRPGGMHTVMKGLAEGQSRLGLKAKLVHRIQRSGEFETVAGDISNECIGGVGHFHFAHGARPILRHSPYTRIFERRLLHFHGPWAAEGRVQGDRLITSAVKWIFEWDTYRRFHEFIAASSAFASVLANSYKVPSQRIHVVHPGVDTDRFTPRVDRSIARSLLGIDPEVPVVATVRRLENRMGIDNAIHAVAQIPDVQLIIAGAGSLEQPLKRLIEDLGMGARVRLLGKVSDDLLPEVYRAADVVLVPSIALEGFGMVVLESFACGTPVIASRLGGLVEALGPFADEFTVEPRSIPELTEHIRYALTSTYSAAAFRIYAQSRSLIASAAELENLLKE